MIKGNISDILFDFEKRINYPSLSGKTEGHETELSSAKAQTDREMRSSCNITECGTLISYEREAVSLF